jgi:hypothetical protein
MVSNQPVMGIFTDDQTLFSWNLSVSIDIIIQALAFSDFYFFSTSNS